MLVSYFKYKLLAMKLWREVSEKGTLNLVEVSEEEIAAAKEKYLQTGECDCMYIYDEFGHCDYHLRYCGICGKFLDII